MGLTVRVLDMYPIPYHASDALGHSRPKYHITSLLFAFLLAHVACMSLFQHLACEYEGNNPPLNENFLHFGQFISVVQ